MSGGTSDNAVLCICHAENGKCIVDLIEKQAGNSKPFDPHRAVAQFAERLHDYGCSVVIGDHYGGSSFAFAFERYDIIYRAISGSASDQYEAFEPQLNAGVVELLDDPTTIEELLTLVVRGTKVAHEPGSHDDHANALALAVNAVLKGEPRIRWFMTGISFEPGGRSFEKSSLDAEYQPDADAPTPFDDPAIYQRAMSIRGTVRVNGQPLPWKEIMQKVRSEHEKSHS
jgi:hypothetical protein